MSKKKNFNQERNPLQMVLYIAAVCVLLIFLVILIFQDKKKQKNFEEQVQELSVQETEMMMTERQAKEETESETEAVQAASENVKNETEKESELKESSNAAKNEKKEKETKADATKKHILVLNGTKLPGVAGNWKVFLEEKGYTNIHTASYSEAPEKTQIYTDQKELGEALKTQFPDAVVQKGKIETGIELEAGKTLPETIDAYVVIGVSDATVQ